MKKLLTNPLFLVGLGIRLAMIASVMPVAIMEWYAPFMEETSTRLTLDPWQSHLSHGGRPEAFPYGYVMWAAFLPLTLCCKFLGVPVAYGYGLTLLMVDLTVLGTLHKMLPGRDNLLQVAYWLSPIVLMATYWFGLNDLVPVLLLTLALYFTKQRRLFVAGVFCAAAISAKLSMVLALPFFFIYLTRHRGMFRLLPDYVRGLMVAMLIFCVPFVFSASGIQMLISNPEMKKVYQFSLDVGNGTRIYVLPLAYMVMLYLSWRVGRLNFELFNTTLGTAFLLVVLLTPASPGWFIWIMPLLVFYQANGGAPAIALTATFSLLYVLSSLLVMPSPSLIFDTGRYFSAMRIFAGNDTHLISLLHTMILAIGVIFAMRVWRQDVSFNNYFRLTRKPFAIGIAGDSGAGKDTLADSLQGLFGSHSVARLSGDDYHLWDRQKPMWQVMTHLNPMANDLECFTNDLVALKSGKSIACRRYDHETGKMSRPFRVWSNDFIIASGLHALYLPVLRDCYNLRIYLDIDESLRRYYKLHRDVGQRGHSEESVLSSLKKREPDAVRFVRPQLAHADLVLSLQPVQQALVASAQSPSPNVRLFMRSRCGLNGLSLTRVLVGVCGLRVDMTLDNTATEIALTIEGDTTSEDVALAATMLFPRILEFLDIMPQWKDGTLGIMQLMVLAHINQAFDKRLLC